MELPSDRWRLLNGSDDAVREFATTLRERTYIWSMSPITLRLKELRTTLGLTQSELATKAGVRRATVSRIENELSTGIDFDVLERLAEALDVDAGTLVVHTRKPRRKAIAGNTTTRRSESL